MAVELFIDKLPVRLQGCLDVYGGGEIMGASGKSRILLVDDDTNLLLTLGDFLSFEGYEIETADSAEQGLKKLKSVNPDLIVLDMSMPGMGGTGFLKAIAADGGNPSYPVLVLTARANMEEFFNDMAVDGFVAKPCEPNVLLKEVARILFLHRAADKEGAVAKDRSMKVLIGEDDGSACHRIADKFDRAGYEVEIVSKGPDVLERALMYRPDVIVLKLVLTGMNGDAVAEILNEMPSTKNIPIVLYDDSGVYGSDGKSEWARSGVKKYVPNCDEETLLSVVESVLRN
ncbi:MAG: response regulator [Lentisphaerae bacterium]|nr:response regulator [Lentisphaerota bacterium]